MGERISKPVTASQAVKALEAHLAFFADKNQEQGMDKENFKKAWSECPKRRGLMPLRGRHTGCPQLP